MGYKENAARDKAAKAAVDAMRKERERQQVEDYYSSEQAENIRKIKANAAARKAAQNGSCMMARTTLTMLTLLVVVLKAMTRQRSIVPMACDDGGDGKWDVLEPGHPNKKELGCGV